MSRIANPITFESNKRTRFKRKEDETFAGLIRGIQGKLLRKGRGTRDEARHRSKPRATVDNSKVTNGSRNEHSLCLRKPIVLNRVSLPRRFIYRCLFFSNAITRNSAICVIARLGRFRGRSAGLGHASNTRSPTWPDQFTDLPGRSGGENNRPDLPLCV